MGEMNWKKDMTKDINKDRRREEDEKRRARDSGEKRREGEKEREMSSHVFFAV